MAEDRNRGPNESFRRSQSARKRREPPIIDATAAEFSATQEGKQAAAASPSEAAGPELAEAAAAGTATDPVSHAEPVLFGAAAPEGSARVEEPAAPASEHQPTADETSSFGPPPQVDRETSPAAERTDPDPGIANALPPADGGTAVPPRSRSRRRSFMSVLLGTVALALLGAIAGLLYTEPQRNHSAEFASSLSTLQGRVAALEARPDPAKADAGIAGLDQRTGALEGGLASLKKDVADLGTRLGAISAQTDASAAKLSALEQATPSGPPQPPPPSAQPADVAAVSDKVDELARRLAALQDQPQPVPAVQPPVDLGPIEGRIADLDQRLAALDGRIGALGGTVAALPRLDLVPLQASVTAVEHRLAPLEAALAAPKAADRVTEARAQGSAGEARAAPLAVVAQATSQALAEGRPFASELDALRALGVEDATLAPLAPWAAQGAPTLQALKDRWAGLETEALAASRPKSSDNTVLDRFAEGARSLVQVRRVDAAAGENSGSTVSRIGAALDRGDLAGALADWAKLPEAGQRASGDWADAARGRLDAETTAQALVSRAIATMAKAKG